MSALVAFFLSATLFLLMPAPILGMVRRRTRRRAAVVFHVVVGRTRIVFRSASVVERILARRRSVHVPSAVLRARIVVGSPTVVE